MFGRKTPHFRDMGNDPDGDTLERAREQTDYSGTFKRDPRLARRLKQLETAQEAIRELSAEAK